MLNSQQQAKRKSKRYKRSKEVTDYSFERLDASDIALNADTFNYSAMSITDTISNLPYAATITGPTFTILSSNLFPELDTTLHINNNHDSNININNNSQSIIYEEELYTLNLDENYLSTEDYNFVDSIQSPTFSGIFLPSMCYDSSKYSILPMPSSSNE